MAAYVAQRAESKLYLYSLASLPLLFALPSVLPNIVIHKKSPVTFLAQCPDIANPATIFVADNSLVRDVCWFYKTDQAYMLNGFGEVRYGLAYPDSKVRVLDSAAFNDLVAKQRGISDIILVATLKHYRQWDASLVDPTVTVNNGVFSFSCFHHDPLKMVK